MEIAAGSAPTPPGEHLGPGGRRIDWKLSDVGFGVLWFLALFIVFPLPFVAIAAIVSGDSQSNTAYAVNLIAGAGSEAGLVVIAAAYTWGKYGGGWERLGVLQPTLATFGWALAALVGALALGYVYGIIIQAFDVDTLKSQCDDQLPRDVINSTPLMVLAGIVAIGFAPVCEEIFFRGFMFTGMLRAWGLVVGVLASGLLFSMAHLSPSLHKTIVPIFIIGAVFAAAYYRSGNIFSSIMAHCAFNTISFLALAIGGCDPEGAVSLRAAHEMLGRVIGA